MFEFLYSASINTNFIPGWTSLFIIIFLSENSCCFGNNMKLLYFQKKQSLPISNTKNKKQKSLKGIVEFCLFRPQMPSKCMIIALILIFDISSAILGPKIAKKVILDPQMCEI